MNKKFISALLFGAMAIASTSTFVSCKDYDDDIDELHALVDQNSAALTAAKSALEAEIATLKTQMETKDAELASLIQAANAATAENKDAIAKEILRATQAEAALEARIVTAEKAIADIQTVLAGKVDKSEFDSTVKDIYAKLETVTTGLGKAMESIEALKKGLADEETARKAVAADLAQQVAALEALTKRVAAIEGDYLKAADKKALEDKIEEVRKALNAEIVALSQKVDANTTSIDELKTLAQKLSTMVDGISAELNTLNVLVKSALRSIVFIPDHYYWGIEATNILYLSYDVYNLAKTDAETKSTANGAVWAGKGRVNDVSLATKVHNAPNSPNPHTFATATTKSTILDFAANYHLNPSNADLKDAKFTILSDDKKYINTRAAAAGLSYMSHSVNNGILTVNINVANPNAIMSVPANSQVTVFATQVELPGNGEGEKVDTTITSDYATLYADKIKDLVLAHTKTPMTKVENTHCGDCNATPSTKSTRHLFATAAEAAGFTAEAYAPQDTCDWNSTLDLRKLVEIHYTNVEGQHVVMDAKTIEANGLTIKFELTGLWIGDAQTSESAHAQINPEDGYTFRPQSVNTSAEGKHQKEYGAEQTRSSIGRTPLVRVSLVNKSGEVVDYGYIRIRISETIKTVEKLEMYHEYNTGKYTYTCNDVCNQNYPTWSWTQRWDEMENDIYRQVAEYGLSHDEFRNIYELEMNQTLGVVAQYKGTKVQGVEGKATFVALADDKYIGRVVVDDANGPEETNIISWTLTSEQAKAYFSQALANQKGVAIKFEPKNDYNGKFAADLPTVYVWLTTEEPSITINQPSGVIDWSNAKIANYWYKFGSSERGDYEIRTNTLAPEDAHIANLKGQPFDNHFSNVFQGNEVIKSAYVTLKNAKYSDVTWNLVFSASNELASHVYTGVMDNSLNPLQKFRLKVTDETGAVNTSSATYGKYLRAYKDGQVYSAANSQVIAVLKYVAGARETPNNTYIEYVHSEYAYALLNYKSHLEISDAESTKDILDIVISLKGKNCVEIPLTNNEFDVRFLRPINVIDSEEEVTDAATDTLQIINIRDLITLSDWRSTSTTPVWKNENIDYWNYYQIKNITVVGAPTNVSDSTLINNQIYSNMHRGSDDPIEKKNAHVLGNITKEVEFWYHPEVPTNGVCDYDEDNAANYGYFIYKNLSSTVDKFKVLVPLRIEYEWGYVYCDVTITINRTVGNAKPHK